MTEEDITDDCSKVDTCLFVGNAKVAYDKDYLRKHDIKAIIDVSNSSNSYPYKTRSPPTVLKLEINDTPTENILQHFETTYNFIYEHIEINRPVLVHCRSGVSRSATIVAAYLIQNQGITCEDALEIIQEKRPIVRPNPGFMAQLKLFQEMLGITG